MPRPRVHRLGEMQLEILKALWRDGPASVADVHAALGADRFAYTTVATMLRKMEVKGLVRHSQQQRRFIYLAAVSEVEVSRSTTADLVERLFEGNLAEAMIHLLQTQEVSLDELEELERIIRERRRRQAEAK